MDLRIDDLHQPASCPLIDETIEQRRMIGIVAT
jgi:hypothetical protein